MFRPTVLLPEWLTIRPLLSVSAKEKLHFTQFDVSTAFLNGNLKEEIYMKQPEGFSDGTTKVCLLKRSLYGLKAPRCWNSCFEDILNKYLVQYLFRMKPTAIYLRRMWEIRRF